MRATGNWWPECRAPHVLPRADQLCAAGREDSARECAARSAPIPHPSYRSRSVVLCAHAVGEWSQSRASATPSFFAKRRNHNPLRSLNFFFGQALRHFIVYPVHVMTRKSFGLMTRKLSVTESQKSAQLRGTFSRRKLSVASANWAQVA